MTPQHGVYRGGVGTLFFFGFLFSSNPISHVIFQPGTCLLAQGSMMKRNYVTMGDLLKGEFEALHGQLK
jgi:hypothetical protein